MSTQTLIKLNVSNVYNDIETFFNELSSEKTRTAYRHNIREYFMFNYGKELNELTKQDIEQMKLADGTYEKLNRKHASQYQQYLKKKNGNSTVNQKMAAIKSLYKTLQAYGYDVDHVVFAVKPMKLNCDSYGVLSPEQVMDMAEFALQERFHAEEIHAFIYLAAATSIRVGALLGATVEDVRFNDKGNYFSVSAIEKGNERVHVAFPDFVHEKLMAIQRNDTNLLFPNLKADKINDTVQRLANKIGVPEWSRITTHSLRKTGIVFELATSGSLERAQRQSRHKSVQVLMDHYTDKAVDQSDIAGMRMFKKIDHEVFALVNKDELLTLLKETNKTAYDQLALKIQEIVGV